MNDIDEDINNGLFPLRISTKRRKDKTKHFKYEEFDFNVSSKKQTGFITARPVRWALSFEKYLRDPNLKFRWQHKTNLKTKKYSESNIVINYDPTNTIGVNLYYGTGVIVINGNYKMWVAQEFPKIQKLFENEKQPDLGEIEPIDENPHETIENLWVKCDELQSALSNHDDAIQKIIDRSQDIELKLVQSEKDWDKKLTDFSKLLLDDMIQKLGKQEKHTSAKLEGIHNKLNNHQSTLDNQTKKTTGENENEDMEKKSEAERTKLEASIKTELNRYVKNEEMQDVKKGVEELSEQIVAFSNQTFTKTALEEYEASTTQQQQKITWLEAQVTAMKKEVQAVITSSKKGTLPAHHADTTPPEIIHSITATPLLEQGEPSATNSKDTRVTNDHHPPSKHHAEATDKTTDEMEIFMCFDSNGKYIDRRLLWKVKGSIYKRCSSLYTVSQEVEKCKAKYIKYFLINVGCNDLDLKDHQQVFGELEQLIEQIREKYNDIKVIISEITPRKDDRDPEVVLFNELLNSYAENEDDIYVATHSNLRDPQWSLYKDDKHIHPKKIGKYAANIIKALKLAYDISSKRELYTETTPQLQKQSTKFCNESTYTEPLMNIYEPLLGKNFRDNSFPAGWLPENDYSNNNSLMKRKLTHLANYYPEVNKFGEKAKMKANLLEGFQDILKTAFG